jgi:hypothetical protein
LYCDPIRFYNLLVPEEDKMTGWQVPWLLYALRSLYGRNCRKMLHRIQHIPEKMKYL